MSDDHDHHGPGSNGQDTQKLESFAVHKLISLAQKLSAKRRQLRNLADSVDPYLWDNMQNKAFDREIAARIEREKEYRKTEKQSMKLTGLSFVFMTASIGVGIGSKIGTDNAQALATIFFCTAFIPMGILCKNAYQAMRTLECEERERLPSRSDTPQLVREELIRRAKNGEIEIEGIDPDPQDHSPT